MYTLYYTYKDKPLIKARIKDYNTMRGAKCAQTRRLNKWPDDVLSIGIERTDLFNSDSLQSRQIQKERAIYLSLRDQYISGRPMTTGEEKRMWDAWHKLTSMGYRWGRIKNEQLRTIK